MTSRGRLSVKQDCRNIHDVLKFVDTVHRNPDFWLISFVSLTARKKGMRNNATVWSKTSPHSTEGYSICATLPRKDHTFHSRALRKKEYSKSNANLCFLMIEGSTLDFLYPWCYIRKRASILPYPFSSSPNACASSEGGSCPRSIQDLTGRCRTQTEAKHFHFSSSFTKIDHSMDWFLGKPALESMRFLNTRRSCNIFTPTNWKKTHQCWVRTGQCLNAAVWTCANSYCTQCYAANAKT